MTRSFIKMVLPLSMFLLAACFACEAQAQLFRGAPSRNTRITQRPLGNFFGKPNPQLRGGLPLQDSMGRGNFGRYRIRNNRILADGSLQWIPNRDPNLNRVRPALPRPITPSPYSAGPTVGGRIQLKSRPSKDTGWKSAGGWQPWMHVPLDGSQPWNH